VRASIEEREQRVLQALIRIYVERREPVSSRMIEESANLGIRSASIRSVLGQLEREGLVAKPHSSSGRIPTDKGYRAYVDQLLPGNLAEEQERAIDRALREAGADLSRILQATARMLGRFSANIAIMAGPREKEADAKVSGVEIYDRGGNHALLALSLNSGAVRTELVDLQREVKPGILIAASSFLAERLCGHRLQDCRRELDPYLGTEFDEARSVASDVANKGRKVFGPEQVLRITFEGIPEALDQPEFADPDRLKNLLELVSRHELFEQALETFVTAEVGEVSLAIGSENPLRALHPFTLMATRYELAGSSGYLGVLGPRRMRYARTLALIHGIAGHLDRLS
jgi:heat-inducible transcriptional repressor